MSDRIITGSADIQTTGGINFSDIFKKMKENPVGTVTKSILSLPQFQTKAGDGWVLANGASLSTATYPELFAAIGYAYGGSGGNFNIPNMQNRYSRMSGSSSVGNCQSNSTSTSGLSLSTGSASFSGTNSFSPTGSRHEHGPGTLSSPIWFDYKDIYYNASEVSGPNISFPNACAVTAGGSGVTVYRNFVNLRGFSGKTISSGNRCYRIGVGAFPALNGGDSETRPETVVLNWFVRIK
jgi:microcystin-dependent protein